MVYDLTIYFMQVLYAASVLYIESYTGYLHISYLMTYSLWSAMHELSLLLNYQLYR